jgi:cobalt-zinc-cadmium efflux system outer membrane protein
MNAISATVKRTALPLALAAALSAHAQQQTMQMPMPPPAQAAQPAPHSLAADPSAAAARSSLHASAQQQSAQPQGPPSSTSDQQSVQQPILTLQEPEDPTHHTGTHLPGSVDPGTALTPDLLTTERLRPALSLQSFESAALTYNPTIAEAQAIVRRTQQQAAQARLYPNPSIGYSGEHIRGGSYRGGEQGAYIQQQIVLGGKLGLRSNIYRQQAAAALTGVNVQQTSVEGAVEQAFYHALAAQSLVQLQQRQRLLALDAVTTAHHLLNLGQADAPDILQAEIDAEQDGIADQDAQRDYLRSFARLAAISGQPNLPPAPLEGELAAPPILQTAPLIDSIVAGSPDIRRARQQVSVAEARTHAAAREAIPDLTIRAGEWWSGEPLPGTNAAAGPMSFVDAGIKLPLWNRNQGNTDAAKAELQRAQLDLSRQELALRQSAANIAEAYNAARFEAEQYRDQILPRAERACQLYQQKYLQMAAAYPQLLHARQTRLQVESTYIHALASEWSGAIALTHATLTEGLAQPGNPDTTATDINLPNSGSTP